MAGLGVLLETHESNSVKPQIVSKATLHNPKIFFSSPPATATRSSFLHRCFLCRKELSEGQDIYMYRGDKAFCSVECRCRQIFMDEDAGGAAAARAGRRVVGGRGFAY